LAKQVESNVSEQLYAFVLENFPRAQEKALEISDSLIDSGIVDSLGLLRIVEFIETTFEMTVTDADVGIENFSSIQAIASFVMRSTAR
jgi:acyl carrier protein